MAEPARMLSVVVPAYNEEAVIATTLIALIAHLDQQQFEYEIVVVNDASRDASDEAAGPKCCAHSFLCALR